MFISFNLIAGISLGIEWVVDDGDNYVVLDLFIVRILFTKLSD